MQSPSQNESGHSGAATGSPPSSASVLSASLSTDVSSTETTSTTGPVTSAKKGTNVNAKPFQSMVTLNGTEASPGLGSSAQEDQQQLPAPSATRLHSRKSSHASSPGGNTTVGGRMGDGIVNQNMKEDLENWITALGLSPEKPLKVVGCFGQTRDIVMAQRVTPTDCCHPRSRRCRRQDLCRRRQHPLKGLEERQDKKIDESEGMETSTALIKDEDDQGVDDESNDSEGWDDDDDDRLPVFFRGCRDTDSFILADAPLNDEFRTDDTTVELSDAVGGMNETKSSWMMGFGQQSKTGDIRAYIDRSKNQLLLQHTYLYDSQSMLSACLQSVEKTRGDRASLLKWMHDQEYESHRALLFLFLVSQVMVYTSPDMNIDPRMVSVLSALLTIKKQIMQEMDRFMTICWDRIGVLSPDQQRQNSDKNNDPGSGTGGGISGRAANSMANIFTPGKCVPVLVFVIERVQVSTPWHDPFASEQQVQEHLRQQVLKKSVDAIQTRLRYILRACRLIQTSDQPVGVFDARQLFVLPSPSSTPFVHVIPYFIGRLELPEREPDSLEEDQDHTVLTGLDPAATMMNRQKTKGSGSSKRQHGPSGKNLREQRDKSRSNSDQQLQPQSYTQRHNPGNSDTFGMPGLRDLYDAITQAKDKPLGKFSAATSAGTATTVATGPKSRSNNSGTTSSGTGTATEDAASSTTRPISLGSLYADYSGPLLRNFVDGWVQNTTSVGGYGNVIGKRNAGTVEIPSLQQWVAGSLGVCEALGVTNLESPLVRSDNSINPNEVRYANRARTSDQEDSGAVLAMSRDCQGLQQGSVHQQQHGSVSEDGTVGLRSAAKSSKRTGGSKKYSLRCANSVTRRIQEFVQSDEVMEELYGAQDQDPTQAASRAHSDRYRQLKADQAQKLFQSLAHRR